MKREATITPDGLYRLDLTRSVEPGCMCGRCSTFTPFREGYALWILANPSTASAVEDDPTERRGWGFTCRWGYGQMVFVNTNPYRSTDPREVTVLSSQVETLNEYYLETHARLASIIVCAWGTVCGIGDMRRTIRTLEGLGPKVRNKVHTLGLTQNEVPKHPLYIPYMTNLRPWLTGFHART